MRFNQNRKVLRALNLGRDIVRFHLMCGRILNLSRYSEAIPSSSHEALAPDVESYR